MGWLNVLQEGMERRRAMRDLRRLEADEQRDGYWTFKDKMAEALDCLERDQRRRAREVWEQAYKQFPREALRSPSCSSLMLKLELYDDFESLMLLGQKRYPGEARYLEGFAQVAYERSRWEEALLRCRTIQKKHPYSVKGYSIAASSLSRLGRSAEAEAIFTKALGILPEDPGLRIDYAKLAEHKGDWNTALERWDTLYAKCNHLAGIAGAATSLARLGRFDEADTLISSVAHKSGTDHLIWLASAQVAEMKGDWEQAAARWDTYRRRFPLVKLGYINGLRPLLKLERHAEADDILRQGIDRLPEEPGPLIEYALLAHRRNDWIEADQRWADVRARFPARREGYLHGADALAHAGKPDQANEIRSRQPA